jgi:PPOX class probable F420-dependent enzyme
MPWHKMPRSEWEPFAAAGTRTGHVAVTRADGSPHVAPVWFVLDTSSGVDRIFFNTAEKTVKARALRRDPRFAMSVDVAAPPYSFVLFYATASIVDDPVASLPWSVRIGARYMGEERGAEFGRRNAVPGELLIVGTITKVVAEADIAE